MVQHSQVEVIEGLEQTRPTAKSVLNERQGLRERSYLLLEIYIFIIKTPPPLNHASCITLSCASCHNTFRTSLEMLSNWFCLNTVIPVVTNFCGPLSRAPFSYPRVHTKARDFNFARCQRLLIMSKNTIPAFCELRGSVCSRKSLEFFCSMPFFCCPANRASRAAYGLAILAFS